jgi:hypothetical protein
MGDPATSIGRPVTLVPDDDVQGEAEARERG